MQSIKNFHVILLSHGNMARATLESAEMIIGKAENVSALCLTQDSGPEKFYEGLKGLIDGCPVKNVILITDIKGGTPFNVAFKYHSQEGVSAIITGLSLTMVLQLETAYFDEVDISFVDTLLSEVRESVQNAIEQAGVFSDGDE